MSWTCGTCRRRFATHGARRQHMEVLGHSDHRREGDSCEPWLRSRGVVVPHVTIRNNHFDYECDRCPGSLWETATDLEQHEIEDHLYCNWCDRTFTSLNNIKMHLNSHIHRGTTIICPFCEQSYATANGLCHHLESGSCSRASFLNRDEVYKLVRSKDPSSVVSKSLLDWHGPESYEATPAAWNGRAYEFYFCRRQFSSLSSINQHLASPAHQQNPYHCPNRNGCGREFTILAALMNHLESESCGYVRFETVQNRMKDIINPGRRLAF